MRIELNIPTTDYDEFLLITKLLQDLIQFKAETIGFNAFGIRIDYNTRVKPEEPAKKITIEKTITLKQPNIKFKTPKKKRGRPRKGRLEKDFNTYQRRCNKCKQPSPPKEIKYGQCKTCRGEN